jgi:hypothetical protein
MASMPKGPVLGLMFPDRVTSGGKQHLLRAEHGRLFSIVFKDCRKKRTPMRQG